MWSGQFIHASVRCSQNRERIGCWASRGSAHRMVKLPHQTMRPDFRAGCITRIV